MLLFAASVGPGLSEYFMKHASVVPSLGTIGLSLPPPEPAQQVFAKETGTCLSSAAQPRTWRRPALRQSRPVRFEFDSISMTAVAGAGATTQTMIRASYFLFFVKEIKTRQLQQHYPIEHKGMLTKETLRHVRSLPPLKYHNEKQLEHAFR